MTDRPVHRASLTSREALLFEAGIKLGGVFHQYLGIPVSARTVPSLVRAIEDALRLQPFVRAARVRIDVRRGGPVGRGRFAYRYLTAEMLDVTVTLEDEGVEVEARLAHRPDLNYVLMSVEQVRRRARRARSPTKR